MFGSSKGTKKSSGRSRVAAKYRDPSSGQTWSGRGKAPKWIDAQERSKFLILMELINKKVNAKIDSSMPRGVISTTNKTSSKILEGNNFLEINFDDIIQK